MILFDKIWISCKQATYLHEKKKEGKLGAMDALGLRIHLLYCSFCRLFIKQVEQLEISARKFYQNTEKFHFSSEKKAALQKAFNEELKK